MRTEKTIKMKLKEIGQIRVKHTRNSMNGQKVKKLNLIMSVLRYCLGEEELWV